MRELNVNELKEVSGGPFPLFVAIAVYGEVASFAAIISGIATYNAIRK
ncbi:class IIb bacteriocin, lactobin A/cerein 7B family [Pseudoalteromonas sp. NZS127_1]|uniref:Class IIb bacteriocin, lactobin A/cerein 7B family n=1 Tax=Pseudoalteromonas arctica TaxID=394751 RepID=A0ABU9TF46_9GAMM|nr:MULTISPECIES: class IIb bacteriocin, lactobin A/cerein 7B family [Pseudoalteromonas]MBG9996385.1 class IIb bacteriocin, lactobin A/cerein 7B family [Pseudoalteromonas sp. NZS127_1]MBG9998583.1 class IIb bacteriocin, lactobin A/cerein 7B family [Pseudoalteromonas sp. NSLLW24]MBH0012885.1 class IIb bacteriocin, lactobin A/cerein 7B family [Pseudoalteromonas sp. NZS100_1]MBH0034893.1 class IIb bacteriocin, lactobin A/cerein 7B family [Pseudoalteromonas sp. NZS71_1]MBH0042625.1 class IIb bacter